MSFYRPSGSLLSRFAASLVFAGAVFAGTASNAQLFQTPVPTGWDSPTGTSLRSAGRILNQAAFGPTISDVMHVEQVGISGYVNEQLNQPPYLMPNVTPQLDYSGYGDCNGWDCDPETDWWQDALFGQDQLRQRVAYALSKLFVVSYDGVDPRYYPYYLNALSRDALGNWFDLMKDVSLSGAMGTYLDAANSQAAAAGGHADENFARELMQLFSIGTVALNQDGSVQRDGNGNTIPNYTPATVQSFARAYTGYTFANDDCSKPSKPLYYFWPDPPGAGCAMQALDQYHDTAPQTLLRGVTLPAGQSTEADFTAALQNVFNDPSLPPFVCRRLIQNLVKSNPSPAYISRIAGVFINDGGGVRGDMKAVVRAILLDPEAREDDQVGASDPNTGMLRDPTLWWISVLRALGATQNTPFPWRGVYKNTFNLWLTDLGQDPHHEPSVFSFYEPNFTINGGTLYAPEFQLENTHSISPMIEHLQDMLNNDFYLNPSNEFSLNLSASSPFTQIAATQGPAALVDALSALLMQGSITPQMQSTIVQAIQLVDPVEQVKDAIFLIVTSPQYRVVI